MRSDLSDVGTVLDGVLVADPFSSVLITLELIEKQAMLFVELGLCVCLCADHSLL